METPISPTANLLAEYTAWRDPLVLILVALDVIVIALVIALLIPEWQELLRLWDELDRIGMRER